MIRVMECTIGKSADDAKFGECQQAGEIGWQGPCVIQQGEVQSSAPGEEPAPGTNTYWGLPS